MLIPPYSQYTATCFILTGPSSGCTDTFQEPGQQNTCPVQTVKWWYKHRILHGRWNVFTSPIDNSRLYRVTVSKAGVRFLVETNILLRIEQTTRTKCIQITQYLGPVREAEKRSYPEMNKSPSNTEFKKSNVTCIPLHPSRWPCHGQTVLSPVSHRGGPGLILVQSVWDS